jgi:uncharacterized protein (DUF983 family)
MERDAPEDTKGQPGLAAAALFGLCPDCGQRTLFAGLARFADRCRVCGLDFSRYNVGDGGAAFLILIIAGLVIGLAVIVQLLFAPPFWVQAAIWLPVTIGLTIWGTRVAKAALLVSEHRRDAREGRIVPDDEA